MVAAAKPPRLWPTQAWAARYISAPIPETLAKAPINTNSGITLSVKTAEYEKAKEPMILSAAVVELSTAIPTAPTSIIASPIGMRSASSKNKAAKPVMPASVGVISWPFRSFLLDR